MSKAFTKEDDGHVDALPERAIPPHRNLVTVEGMAAIEAEITRLQAVHEDAINEGDATAGAISARDLGYWTSRRVTAELVEAAGSEQVRFGSYVTIRRPDGSEKVYRLVGSDEADPKHGTLSYVAPLAQAMMGKTVGDIFVVTSREATIVHID